MDVERDGPRSAVRLCGKFDIGRCLLEDELGLAGLDLVSGLVDQNGAAEQDPRRSDDDEPDYQYERQHL
jgi:hypothetical protein